LFYSDIILGGLIYTKGQESYLVGIVSASKRTCSPYVPTLFASVVPNLPWIKAQMLTQDEKNKGKDCNIKHYYICRDVSMRTISYPETRDV